MKGIIFGTAIVVLLTGCGSSTSEGAAACAAVLRHDGTVYVGTAPTQRAATKLGFADQAACSDTGEDARGIFFPNDPKQIRVWSFDGLDHSKVVGARGPDGGMYFYVAEGLSKAEAGRISGTLSGESSTGR